VTDPLVRSRYDIATPDPYVGPYRLVRQLGEGGMGVVHLAVAPDSQRVALKQLRPHVVGTWQIDPMSAEVIDGSIAREELRGGWVGGVAGPAGEIVVSTHGSVIDVAAAKRCGAQETHGDPNRMPSAVSLRLFQPAGRAILDSWLIAWREVFETTLAPSNDIGLVTRIIEARSILRIALSFSGDLSGRIVVYVRPEMLVPPSAALAAIKASAAAIANALANVPVEVIAELGTLRLTLRKIRALQPGATFALQGFVDSRVPVYCGGVLKAWAVPVVYRGVLAVRIESVVHGQGTKS